MAVSSKTDDGVKDAEFDWITLRSDMDKVNQVESPKEKMLRKINENPWVPIGCLATATVLSVGLWSFRTGRRQLSQTMMRARIAAQGFTVISLVVGIVIGTKK